MAASLSSVVFCSVAFAISYAEFVISSSVTTEREAPNVTLETSDPSEALKSAIPTVTQVVISNETVTTTEPTTQNVSSAGETNTRNVSAYPGAYTVSSQSSFENSTTETATTTYEATKLPTESEKIQSVSMMPRSSDSSDDNSTATTITPETTKFSLKSEESQSVSTTERFDNSSDEPAPSSPTLSSSRSSTVVSLTSASLEMDMTNATLKEMSSLSVKTSSSPMTVTIAESSSSSTVGTTTSSTTTITTTHPADVVTMTTRTLSDIRCAACENAQEACSCDDGSKIKPIYGINGGRKEKQISEDTLDPTGVLLELTRPCFDIPLQYGVCSGHMLAW